MMINKNWYKVAVSLLSILSSDILLDFQDSIRVVPVKHYFFFSWYIYYIILKYSWKKYVAPLRILNLFIKSSVNPFVNIASTFFRDSFNSFLFDVISFISLSKSVLLKKLLMSLLLARLARFNLKAQIFALNLLNSGVVIYIYHDYDM